MASSGRVPQEVVTLMGQVITVREPTSVTETDLWGENEASGNPVSRDVQCYLAPFTAVTEGSTMRNIIATYVAYCDDVNLEGNESVTLPNGNVRNILRIETFYDAMGPLYQVLTVE